MLLICVLSYCTDLVFRGNASAWFRGLGASRPKEIPAVPQLEDQEGEVHRIDFHFRFCGKESGNFIGLFNYYF